jgi:putative adenylate-forming enzyme
MDQFDAWLTDPAVTRTQVEAFTADKSQVGQDFLDRYSVWTTSGTTGSPGIFLHDQAARSVYDQLILLRGVPGWLSPRTLAGLLRRPFGIAFLITTGAHFAGEAFAENARNRSPWLSSRFRIFSVLAPMSELVAQLNQFRPAVLAGYPTALWMMANQKQQGKLDIAPRLLMSTSEWLDPTARATIERTFTAKLNDMYGASEFPCIAFTCKHNRLHLNQDWVILEPVDDAFQPVPPGKPSHTVLLTNLANRIQPIIRYDLGDSLTMLPEPCPCGSRLPALRVEGRQDEILSLASPQGGRIQLLPMALATVVEETPGVMRYQIIQTAPEALKIRFDTVSGADQAQVWQAAAYRMQQYLAGQGLPSVRVMKGDQPPQRDPTTGKLRQVYADMDDAPQKETIATDHGSRR